MIDVYKAVKLKPLTDTVHIEDISDKVYFSKAYSKYISNSRLKLINPDEGGSPSKFFAGLNNNKIYSDALIFGSAVHELTLQPNDFVLTNIDRPTAKAGFMADYIYENYINPEGEWIGDNIGEIIAALEDNIFIEASDEIDYYKGKMNDDKITALKEKCKQYWIDRAAYEDEHRDGPTPIYLPSKMREQLSEVLNAFNKNNKFTDLLNPKGLLEDPISKNETTILMDMEYEVTLPEGEVKTGILHLKSKLDNFTVDNENNTIIVNDVKTTGKYVTEFASGAFNFFHYYRELGMYTWLLKHAVAKHYNIYNPTIKSNCLVVETFPGYFTKTYELTKTDLLKGMQEFGWLLRQVAYFKAVNDL